MKTASTKIRVRYGEVDQMGFVYYGNYALYFEAARAEIIRDAGYAYNEMEKDGTVMPVVKMTTKYIKPALYEDLIRIETSFHLHTKNTFITFQHKVYNEQNDLLNIGEVTLTFMNPKIGKRVEIPEKLNVLLQKYYST